MTEDQVVYTAALSLAVLLTTARCMLVHSRKLRVEADLKESRRKEIERTKYLINSWRGPKEICLAGTEVKSLSLLSPLRGIDMLETLHISSKPIDLQMDSKYEHDRIQDRIDQALA